MSQHTPGPWKLGNINHFHAEYVVKDGMEGAICSVLPTEETEEGWQRGVESQANSRLIAAAPDLLEALEYALSMWGDYLPPSNSNAMKAIKQARAAIAKARGES